MVDTLAELKKLITIAEEMNRQENRATAFPLFVVEVERERHVGRSMDWEEKRRRDDVDESYLCEACREKRDDLPEDCDDCSDDAFLFLEKYREIDTTAGVFLTAKECDALIDARRHAYGPEAHSYAIAASYSQEMKTVLQYLSLLGGDGVNPSMPYRI